MNRKVLTLLTPSSGGWCLGLGKPFMSGIDSLPGKEGATETLLQRQLSGSVTAAKSGPEYRG